VSIREPGEILDGKYEIVQRLGSGGMGEVHLVRHLHLQELRVIKILHQDLAADPSAQARFLREARLATQIKHPNVAILYDFSRLPDGSFYMVWDHIQGQDVGDYLRRQGAFPVLLAIQLGVQTLRGLEAIHATGVIHRDLSPDNLMLTEDRRGHLQVKIIDLGLAKHLEPGAAANVEITQVGMFLGKLQYCSPEQAGAGGGEGLDRRSDLYSFSLVLYEMLVGRPPFESENPQGFILKRLSEDPLPLVGRNPQVVIPPELDRVIRRGLERDREKRFPDAIRYIQALEKIAQGLSGVETQEIQMAPLAAAMEGMAQQGTAGTRAASRPASGPATLGPAGSLASPSPAELSREEKQRLLGQIERAGQRAHEMTQILTLAEVAIEGGRLEEARRLLIPLEIAGPRAPRVVALRRRLENAEAAQLQRRVAETEQVLTGYLKRRQLPLARLAFETLLEMMPDSPRKDGFATALGDLARELEQEKVAVKAVESGRAALHSGDLRTARRELEAVTRSTIRGEITEHFRAELGAAEREQRQTNAVDDRRRRLEELIQARKIAEAETEYEQLARLAVPRVVLDAYRTRLQEVRSQADAKQNVAEFERRYRVMVEAEDWFGAREVAHEFETTLPGHARAAAMFGEIARLESDYRQQQAFTEGVAQVEAFLAKRDADMAELALKVLLQMDPFNKHRRRLEKQVRELRGG
jgi:tRNA A-37 threonylcarbamoyl transferase component Bud32